MAIELPKYIALDTATLGKIARDYWGTDPGKRTQARVVIEQLSDASIYLVISYTHLCELIRHDDIEVAKERIAWLSALPMIAWIRPYRGNWFLGSMLDIALRELSAIVHDSAKCWTEIIDRVRHNFLETGVGNDMFVDRPELWSAIRYRARETHLNQMHIASLARADYGDVYSKKYSELTPLDEMPHVSPEAAIHQAVKAAQEIARKVSEHGDKRISAKEVATDFVVDLMKDMDAIEAIQGKPDEAIMQHFGIPREMVKQNTKIGEIGEFGIHAGHLRLLCSALKPPVSVSILDVPPNSLPSFTVERELMRDQHGAERVEGSDLGDCHLLPLALYLDAVEVDKRAHDHVRKIRRRNARIEQHLGTVFRSPDYSKIPAILANEGVI